MESFSFGAIEIRTGGDINLIDYICFMNLVETHIDQINELCEIHRVEELYLFGSILTDRFSESSDIDMLIRFRQVDLMEYFDNYMDLKEKLEQLLHRTIDLVEYQAIRNPIFRNILEREKRLVYERKSA